MANVYDAPTTLRGREPSIASTPASARSAGFPDIDEWARVVDALLRPGGRLHLVEFHPVTHWCLSETDLTVKYSYFHEGPWVWDDDPDEPGSYADPDATFEHNDTVEWNHGIGAIVTALARGRSAHRVARRAADAVHAAVAVPGRARPPGLAQPA